MHKNTKRCTAPHSLSAVLRVTPGWVLPQCPPAPPLSTWPQPPSAPLLLASHSREAPPASLPPRPAPTLLWCLLEPVGFSDFGVPVELGESHPTGRRYGADRGKVMVEWCTATPVNLTSLGNCIGNVLLLCPLKLWSHLWAWKFSIWATPLVLRLLVSFAMNSKKATFSVSRAFSSLPHLHSFLLHWRKKERRNRYGK